MTNRSPTLRSLQAAAAALTLVVGAAVALAPAEAQACSCIDGWTDLVAPADGASDVPTNARVSIGGAHFGVDGNPDALISLLDADGAAVPTSITEVSGNGTLIAVLRPDAELAAGASYEVRNGGGEVLSRFTVGDSADAAAPPIPVETGRESRSSARGPGMPVSSCGNTDMITISLESEGLIVVANIEDADGIDTDSVDGFASEISLDGVLRIGSAGCTWSWPDAAPGSSTSVSWGTFDLAGNFSGWSGDDSVSVPPAGSSCSAAGPVSPSPAAALALLLGAAGVVGMRRR